MIKGVPQSEEPRTLLFGFTLSFSLGAILEKDMEKSTCFHIQDLLCEKDLNYCCNQAVMIAVILTQ